MEADMLQLSAQLTQAIALVELQRATVEESILRLFGEAQQLNQVSDALCEAATTQGTVLIHLQQLLQSGKAPSEMAESLAPAALGIAAASGALAAPPLPPPSEPGPSWSVGEAGGPVQGDTVWHDGQQCTVQYVNSKGLLDLRNQGGAVFYGVAKVELSPPGPSANGGSGGSGGRGGSCGGTSESGEADSPRDSPRSDVVTDFRTPANTPLVPGGAVAAVAAVAPAAVAPLVVPVAPAPRPPPQVIEPEFSSDEEGIEYVKNLRIGGGAALGATLEVSGEFVGSPSCQWYRVSADGTAVAIDGATEMRRQVTARSLITHPSGP